MSIGEKLKSLRGKTPKEQVAMAIGITVSSLTKYERNERVPRDEVKIRLAEIYGTSVQDIFFSR